MVIFIFCILTLLSKYSNFFEGNMPDFLVTFVITYGSSRQIHVG